MKNKSRGFCILCGKNIPLDINQPFCKKCYSHYKNLSLSSEIDGKYCHYCRRINESISNHYPQCKECRPFDRHDNSINDYYLEKIKEYRSMSLSERQKIKPHWFCNENTAPYQLKSRGILIELRMTEVLKILESEGNLITTDVFSNEPKSNRRIMNILKAWNKGIQIEPPSISYGNSDYISDGRHRILAAHFLGAETLPVYRIKMTDCKASQFKLDK
jgi:hypothetical protein